MTTGPENPYGEPQQPQQPYQQQPPPPPYGYGYQQPYAYNPPLPKHPSATTAMALGIVGLAGVLACGGVTLVVSPFAWGIGSRAVREIDAAPPGTVGGREEANAGRIMGIIGTVLLILAALAVIAFVVLVVAVSDNSSTTYDSTY